ncbi:Na+/H+ antiporter subunit E [Pseudomonas sp. KSR10]|jgi:multicomponent Na+:H+ antiporter subunit E|uniref:Multisubunit Na+/H+ antiporter subunit MnhE n=1 Tax=Stutzerimonas stutzeri TaxID=316 RepID=A0A0D9AW88_STUST|nr:MULTISPECIES: Na+/H+ antiporter subunit E [Pseudomonadaceae]KJH84939.1 multisubunit Na+/H+ antiporter subunit MnhE [Stutzerimonas stutzeri]MCG6539319.1 Na+/H+ antiporter subunit E [Pseudomonas sp. KSR10]
MVQIGIGRWVDGLGWALLYAALWALFAEGGGWALGVPSILLAVALSLRLGSRPWQPALRALPGFAWFFLGRMTLGAWDVAVRALHPRRSLQPAWLDYRLRSESPRVRLLLSALVGLLPGTLASRIDADCMRVHVLDRRQRWEPTVIELEDRLMRLVGDGDNR